MRRRILVLAFALALVVALSSSVVANSFAQAAAGSYSPQRGVALTKLCEPVYPPLARQTGIAGDVKLLLGIRPDGTVESAVIVNGHPLLQQAALESAQQSQFECRGCGDPVTSYSMVYTFQLAEPRCSKVKDSPSKIALQDAKPRTQVTQSQNHVTVIDAPEWCGEGVFSWKVRSAKCLYLWKCGWRM
jgi:TonB family protein